MWTFAAKHLPFAFWFLSQLFEITSGFLHCFTEKTDLNASSRFTTNGDIEENLNNQIEYISKHVCIYV